MHNPTTLADPPLPAGRLVSRVTILIVAVVLLAMGVGSRLPAQQSTVYLVWGCFGLTAYFILELAAKYKSFRKDVKSRTTMMHKLDQIVTTDSAIKFVRQYPGPESEAKSAPPDCR